MGEKTKERHHKRPQDVNASAQRPLGLPDPSPGHSGGGPGSPLSLGFLLVFFQLGLDSKCGLGSKSTNCLQSRPSAGLPSPSRTPNPRTACLAHLAAQECPTVAPRRPDVQAEGHSRSISPPPPKLRGGRREKHDALSAKPTFQVPRPTVGILAPL